MAEALGRDAVRSMTTRASGLPWYIPCSRFSPPIPASPQAVPGMKPVLPALCYSQLRVVPPGTRRSVGASCCRRSHRGCGWDSSMWDRVLLHPGQVLPGQGLAEGGGDLSPCPELLLRHTSPAHHGPDQFLHVQDGETNRARAGSSQASIAR